jgi:hypothetical protein
LNFFFVFFKQKFTTKFIDNPFTHLHHSDLSSIPLYTNSRLPSITFFLNSQKKKYIIFIIKKIQIIFYLELIFAQYSSKKLVDSKIDPEKLRKIFSWKNLLRKSRSVFPQFEFYRVSYWTNTLMLLGNLPRIFMLGKFETTNHIFIFSIALRNVWFFSWW